jgi:hypothetical protein
VAQTDRQESRREEKGNGLSAAERDELARLRRKNKQLRLEHHILSRAAAWFARETGARGRAVQASIAGSDLGAPRPPSPSHSAPWQCSGKALWSRGTPLGQPPCPEEQAVAPAQPPIGLAECQTRPPMTTPSDLILCAPGRCSPSTSTKS